MSKRDRTLLILSTLLVTFSSFLFGVWIGCGMYDSHARTRWAIFTIAFFFISHCWIVPMLKSDSNDSK